MANRNKNWLTDFHEQYSRIKGWSSKNIKDSAQSSFQIIGLAADHLHKILSEFRNNKYCLYSNSEELEKQTQRMLENLNLMQDCLCHSDSDNTNTNSDQIEEYEVIQARNFFEKFLSTLSRPSFLAGKNRVLLLTGPAGSGKSHLLCDFTRKQMERGQPVVLYSVRIILVVIQRNLFTTGCTYIPMTLIYNY